MKLVIPTFDQFKAYVKRYKDIEKHKDTVDTASFLSQAFPFKVPFIIDDDRKGWDAKEQALVLPADDHSMNIIHEAWHFFMCPPDMLRYNDFGLGPSVDGHGLKINDVRKGNDYDPDMEEEAVCYFSIATARKLHIPRGAIMLEMDYANLKDPFLNGKIKARDEYKDILKLAKKRDLSRFGFDVSYA